MIKKELRRMSIDELIPYENNPRRNDDAVADVAESIRQCEDLDPIEVDENMVILSGHTRLKALQQLGYEEADVMIYTGLTEEQKKKYRLLANKTGEKAGWDFEKLQQELKDLDFGDFDFGFHTDSDVNIDDLFADAPEKPPKEPEQIQCPHCKLWFTKE